MNPYPIQKIMAYLPHRYPFLLVDRVLEIVPREHIVALKNVTFNEPFFQGHFPENPIMPGVLIVEALAQAGGILAYESLPPERRGQEVYFMGFNNVKFRKPVVPGDQLIFRVNFLRQRGNAFKMAGRAEVAETLVAEAECLASIGEKG
jgi:beta-hydroxyacyl-ACP dehydratase FabZ